MLFLTKSNKTYAKTVNYLGIALDKNISVGYHVQMLLCALATFESVITQLKHFSGRFMVIGSHDAFREPLMRYGFSNYGYKNGSIIFDLVIFIENRRSPSDEIFVQSKFVNVFNLIISELLDFTELAKQQKGLKNNSFNTFTAVSSCGHV